MSLTLRLLGPVRIDGAAGARPRAPERALELVAFLHLHPWHNSQLLDEALWPGKRVTAAARNVPMNSARSWLGTTTDGRPHVAFIAHDGYRLHQVSSDWQQLQQLLTHPVRESPTPALTAALDLVTGQPLSGVNPVRYRWAEVDRQQMITTIGDIALELAGRSHQQADHRALALAVAKGLQVEPNNEALWRHALISAAHSAQPGRLEQVRAHLHATLDPLGELEDATVELLERLKSGRSLRAL